MNLQKVLALLIIVPIVLSGCTNNDGTGNAIVINSQNIEQFTNETLPLKVAELSEINLNAIENFEHFKDFADKMNALIKILNEQNNLFKIPQIEVTQENWDKASKLINEYGPLINNYNEVVSSAKKFKLDRTQENLQEFYKDAGKFGFEFAVISWAVFYSASFQFIGIVYRGVGLNTLALKCGSCVSVVLSEAHWTVRTVLVETSSVLARQAIDFITDLYNKYQSLYDRAGGL